LRAAASGRSLGVEFGEDIEAGAAGCHQANEERACDRLDVNDVVVIVDGYLDPVTFRGAIPLAIQW
jgi:hypothetical protein